MLVTTLERLLYVTRMLTESFVTLQNASSNSSNHNRCHNLPGNRRKSWLRSTKNDNSSCERAHAIFRWASTIFCWASTCQFLITRLLIGQRASYNRFFHWLFPDANDGSNDRTKDHRSFPNMKLPTAAKTINLSDVSCQGMHFDVASLCYLVNIWKNAVVMCITIPRVMR